MPADLATIYNLNRCFHAGITGKGQTIVVIEDEDAYSLGDWSSFRKVAGLSRTYPYGSISQTHPAPPTGANNCTDPGDLNDGTDDEVAIDMEWASAAAPNAAIQVAVCKDSGRLSGG
jgi:subtilase family serine protease